MLVKVLIDRAGRPLELSHCSLLHWLNPLSQDAGEFIVNFLIFALCYEIFAVK